MKERNRGCGAGRERPFHTYLPFRAKSLSCAAGSSMSLPASTDSAERPAAIRITHPTAAGIPSVSSISEKKHRRIHPRYGVRDAAHGFRIEKVSRLSRGNEVGDEIQHCRIQPERDRGHRRNDDERHDVARRDQARDGVHGKREHAPDSERNHGQQYEYERGHAVKLRAERHADAERDVDGKHGEKSEHELFRIRRRHFREPHGAGRQRKSEQDAQIVALKDGAVDDAHRSQSVDRYDDRINDCGKLVKPGVMVGHSPDLYREIHVRKTFQR